MLSKILKSMTDAISVLSSLEKTYIACCVALVLIDNLGGFSPAVFKFGFMVLIGGLVPVLILAKKNQKTVSAILSGILLVCIYTLGRGYLVA